MSRLYKIPNNFIDLEYEYVPGFISGYEHHHYANFDNPVDLSEYYNWNVLVLDALGNVVQTAGGVSVDEDNSRFYFSFTLSESLSGVHFMAIRDISTGVVVYQSSFFKIVSLQNIVDYVFLKFRNSSDLDNVSYSTFPYYQSVLLDIDQLGFDYEYINQNYDEKGSGAIRMQKSKKRKFLKLGVYLFDELGFDALASICDHDDVEINGDAVTLKTGVSPEEDKEMSIFIGSLEYYINSFATVNLKGP